MLFASTRLGSIGSEDPAPLPHRNPPAVAHRRDRPNGLYRPPARPHLLKRWMGRAAFGSGLSDAWTYEAFNRMEHGHH
jgi:hypothetical protein